MKPVTLNWTEGIERWQGRCRFKKFPQSPVFILPVRALVPAEQVALVVAVGAVRAVLAFRISGLFFFF